MLFTFCMWKSCQDYQRCHLYCCLRHHCHNQNHQHHDDFTFCNISAMIFIIILISLMTMMTNLLFTSREMSKTINAAIAIVVRDDSTFFLPFAFVLHHLGDHHHHCSQHHHRSQRHHRSNHHRVIIIMTFSWPKDPEESLQS